MTNQNQAELTATLHNRHTEIHELLGKVAAITDGHDPEASDWGQAGNLGWIARQLREIVEAFDN
jgi:hypothetical protein